MYIKRNNKGIKELRLGDRIGDSGIIFICKDHEHHTVAGSYAYTMCPFCGTVKSQRLADIYNGSTSSCGCRKGRRKTFTKEYDANGNTVYEEGYPLLFGWNYVAEAGMKKGQRMVQVQSKWDENDVDEMPISELDAEYNLERVLRFARWARSYVETNNIDLQALRQESEPQAAKTRRERKSPSDKNGTIPTPNGGVNYYGYDEKWIKTLVLSDINVAKAVVNHAYVVNGNIFGQTDNIVRDRGAKYADLRTLSACDGWETDIFEEYDACNHNIKNPSARDIQVELGCARNNKGLFRISTRCHCIKDRDAATFLAIREKAMEIIKRNIVANFQAGYTQNPTLIRVTIRRGVEFGMAMEDRIQWTPVATIPEFLMGC